MELEIGSAIDLSVQEQEAASNRAADALHWGSDSFVRIKIASTISIQSRKITPAWRHRNGIAKFTWSTEIQPGQSATFESRWHYFWN